MVYQLGLPPNRIDVLTDPSGVHFDECIDGAIDGMLGANRVRFIALEAQLKNKRATGRTKDRADAEMLEVLAQQKRSFQTPRRLTARRRRVRGLGVRLG